MMIGLGLAIPQLAVKRGNGGQFAGSSLDLDFTSGNQTLDPRITFTRASNATRFNASGTLVTMANNEPRFDYDPVTLAPRGLLIEEQRTNSIRNNTMQGAVAGTPGTLPTNWLNWTVASNGMTASIAAVGTEDGIPYIDWRYQGTYTGATGSALAPSFDGNTAIPATVGQVWSASLYINLVAGSLENVTINTRFSERASDGSLLTVADPTSIPVGVGRLSATRFSASRTNTSASTAFIQLSLRVALVQSQTYDFTLRIGMPQLELGAFATSVIPTTTAAATRAADVAVMTGANFSNWYRQDEGTLFAEAEGALSTSTFFVLGVTDGSTEVAFIRNFSNTARFGAQGIASASAGAISPGQFYKAAFAFTSGGQGMSVNGGGAISGTTTITTAPTLMRIGQNSSGTSTITTHYKRIAYFPRRLSNAELIGLTS